MPVLINPYMLRIPSEGGDESPLDEFVTSYVSGGDPILDEKGNAITLYDGMHSSGGLLQFDDAGYNRLRLVNSGAFTVDANQQFTMEMWIASSSSNTAYNILADISGNGSASGGWFLECSTLRGLLFTVGQSGSVGALSYAMPHDMVERHIMVSRDETGRIHLGVSGEVKDAWLSAGTLGLGNGFFSLGTYAAAALIDTNTWKGTLRGFRFSKGICRYGGEVGGTYDVPTPPPATPE